MIAIERVNQIEVFQNEDGGITVKMTDEMDEEHIIWFPSSQARIVATAILEVAEDRWGEYA